MIKLGHLIIVMMMVLSAGCGEKPKPTWKFDKIISLDNITPLGIVVQDDFLWLSDKDRGTVTQLTMAGGTVHVYEGFKQPMHIAGGKNGIWIPEFQSDSIKIIQNEHILSWPMDMNLDGPGSVAVAQGYIAIAEFYHHRITLRGEDTTIFIGAGELEDEQLNYPTDVEIYDSLIYVADAYNDRIAVFDLKGNYHRSIARNDETNVTTGLTVWQDQIFVADLYKDRILIYDLSSKLNYTVSLHVNRPTDVFVEKGKMFVANNGGKNISVFQFR